MSHRLKRIVGEMAVHWAAEAFGPVVLEQLATVVRLSPEEVADDGRYWSHVVNPTLLAVAAVGSDITTAMPNFSNRFREAMLHLRDELVVIDPARTTVGLVPDAAQRLPDALLQGLKKSSA